MKRVFKCMVLMATLLFSILFFSQIVIAGSVLKNEYIDVSIFDNGRFSIGTVKGNPEIDTDENAKLLYGWPSRSTSYTTIKIDGYDYAFGNKLTVLPANLDEGLINTCLEVYGDIEIRQDLSIVNGGFSDMDDTVEIKYIITNTGEEYHDLGVRIMMDTMLGRNDHAPFKVPGLGDITETTILEGNQIPEFWQAVDDLVNPGVISQGTLALYQNNRPDRFVMSSWRYLKSNMWAYNHTGNFGDSAVAVYWDPKPLAPGETREYVTYYGISKFSSDNKNPIVLNLSGNMFLEANEKGYFPNPFTVVAYLTNNTDSALNNISVKINLPEELTYFTDSEEVIVIDRLESGQSTQIVWNLFAAQQRYEKSVMYTVEVSAEGMEAFNLSREIFIPASISEIFNDEIDINKYMVSKRIGEDFEQVISQRPHIKPSINNVKITHMGEGVYEIEVTDYFVDSSKGGAPFFFWLAEDGYFEKKKIDNYRKVIFRAANGTQGQKIHLCVKMGDGLGNVDYKYLEVDGFGEVSDSNNEANLNAKFVSSFKNVKAWDTIPIRYNVYALDRVGEEILGTRVSLYYSVEDNGVWHTIIKDLIGVNGYNWIVPDINSANVKIKLVATNGSLVKEVVSDSFSVAPDIFIKGRVVDRDENPLPNVKITINDRITYTDVNGYYTINNLSPGKYTVTAEKEGFVFQRSIYTGINLTNYNRNRTINFYEN